MNQMMQIQNQEIQVKEFNGQRVVTFKDIDLVHERKIGTSGLYFSQNQTHFVENEDFFIDGNFARYGNCKMFTVSGYSLLAKQFTTDNDNKAMRDMLHQYFEKTVEKEEDVKMNNELQVFKNQEFGEIRTLCIDGEPWFVGKDVADVLGYEKSRNAIAIHVDEDDALKRGVIDSLGRSQQTTFINESGLYSLILGSRLPSAKKFKRWVTSEVLPTIRKTGSYGKSFDNDEPITVSITNAETLIRCAGIMAGCLECNRNNVLNILRHIVPDVDDSHMIPVKLEETVIEVPAIQNTEMVISTRPRAGYSRPFNYTRLDKFLIKQNINVATLEQEMGVSKGSVYSWRHGKVSPSTVSREKLCRALGVRIGYFDK